MDAAHPELVRAWQLYFGQRGGAGPSLPPDVLPTIVLDDNSNGPYPPYRPWFTSQLRGAVAGQRSACGVANVDGFIVGGGVQTIQPIRSAVVVDQVRWRVQVAGGSNILVAISTLNANPFDGTSDKPVDDAAPEKDPGNLLAFPRIGNVFSGIRSDVGQLGDSGPPNTDLLTNELMGPWILGPGQVLWIQENVLNDALQVYFRGRYYGGR